MLRILLIGATGTFGVLLAKGLAREKDIVTILGGRTRETLEALQRELGGEPTEIAVLDRDVLTAAALRMLRADMVVDAAGPFQDSRTAVIEAAIEAGCAYADLADGRAFVAGVTQFDAQARTHGVSVLSGASSTPALSHAVIDTLTAGWRGIDTIRAMISPGSSAHGLSLVRGVLSYIGRPMTVFREGGWRMVPGWGATRRMAIPGLRCGWASLCETPDLDLFVARYRPAKTAEFLCSLEVPLMHLGMSIIGLLVRTNLLRRPERHAVFLRRLAGLAARLGADRGGMVVEVEGRDDGDKPVSARWSLRAPPGNGPNVPTLAALALVRRLRDGRGLPVGAGPCVGFLELADFVADFDRLGVITKTSVRRGPIGL